MDANELINALKIITAHYDALQPGSPVMRELMIWREKFLLSQPLVENTLQDEYVKKVFKETHCYEMVTKTPEKLYQEISEAYVNDTNK